MTEKMLIEYCSMNAAGCGLGITYNMFTPLAVLSSSYVKKGQPIEITAGVGAFSIVMKPLIIIDGKDVKVDNDGTAVHQFTADGNPGKHSIMVEIEFNKPDGTKGHFIQSLNYTIADEK